ncbi:hypothetical protein [Trabulsiella odontotermitis]|uniref:hypothetical protein n=1 Tax=Trabulsiella odontotermitis TaxID=379893 RepID=UPI00067693A9|nr:hypothetical protein [Trabulsiella odontotermitis]KNC91588.1 hypothetical protein GM30_22170 [Trabulsiella odontotermitis]
MANPVYLTINGLQQRFISAVINACNLSAAEIGQFSVMSVTGALASLRTRHFARQSLAYAIAKKAANSLSLTTHVRRKLNTYITWGAIALDFLGVTHIASLSARRLKMLNRDYYDLLYKNKLEMFFFLLEEHLPAEFYNPRLLISSQNEVVRFLKRVIL